MSIANFGGNVPPTLGVMSITNFGGNVPPTLGVMFKGYGSSNFDLME